MKTQLEKAKEKLFGLKMTPETRGLLERFEREHTDLSRQTIANYFYLLAMFIETTGKPLEKIGKDDIVNFFAKDAHSNGTRNMLRGIIASFYKWVNDGEDPDFIRAAKKTVLKIKRNGNGINADELLTPEDVKKIVGMATNQRDRAFLMVLYESGARIGELLNLEIKDCYFDEYGCRVRLRGKTGERSIRLVDSAADLKAWIENHPGRQDASSRMFVSSHANYGEPVNREWAGIYLRIMAKRAGIKKRMNPHSWRHARLTEMAKNGFTEPELRKFAGWTADSSQCKTYIHLTDADIERKQLKMSGLVSVHETKPHENILRNIECPGCHVPNSVASRFCCACGMGLDSESMRKYKEEKLGIEVYRLLLGSDDGKEVIRKMARENPDLIKGLIG